MRTTWLLTLITCAQVFSAPDVSEGTFELEPQSYEVVSLESLPEHVAANIARFISNPQGNVIACTDLGTTSYYCRAKNNLLYVEFDDQGKKVDNISLEYMLQICKVSDILKLHDTNGKDIISAQYKSLAIESLLEVPHNYFQEPEFIDMFKTKLSNLEPNALESSAIEIQSYAFNFYSYYQNVRLLQGLEGISHEQQQYFKNLADSIEEIAWKIISPESVEPIVEKEDPECKLIGWDELPNGEFKDQFSQSSGPFLQSTYQGKDIYFVANKGTRSFTSGFYADGTIEAFNLEKISKVFGIHNVLSLSGSALSDLANIYLGSLAAELLTCDPSELDSSLFDPKILSYLQAHKPDYIKQTKEDLVKMSQSCRNAYKNLRRLAEWQKLSQEQRKYFKDLACEFARNLGIRSPEYFSVPTHESAREAAPTATTTTSAAPTAAAPRVTLGSIFYSMGYWWFCPLFWPALIIFGFAKLGSCFGFWIWLEETN